MNTKTTTQPKISDVQKARDAVLADPKSPFGLSPEGLKAAHQQAVAMTAGHPELESKVEELAKQGFAAQARGDYATGHSTLLQAYSLINAADDESFTQDDSTLSDQKGDMIGNLMLMLGEDDEDEDEAGIDGDGEE